jgi:hypothetical protein
MTPHLSLLPLSTIFRDCAAWLTSTAMAWQQLSLYLVRDSIPKIIPFKKIKNKLK